MIEVILFLISRLFFLNWGEVFFDSGEYIKRWIDPSFLSSITSGHPPLHLGYVLYNWPLSWLAQQIKIDPLPMIMVLQVLMAAGAVFYFGKIASRLFGNNEGRRAMWLISVIPIFWITNVTVMMETSYLFFFFGSLYFLSKFTEKTGKKTDLILTVCFWIMSFLTHTVVLLWIPLYLYLSYIWSKEKIKTVMSAGVLAFLCASIINALFLAISNNSTIAQGFYWLYAAKFGEHAWFNFSLETVGRYLRNWIVPLAYNSTSLVVIFGGMSLISQWWKEKKIFIVGVLWIVPSIVANQWWDSLLYGRHSLIAIFGLALYASVLLKNTNFKLVVGLIAFVSLTTLRFLLYPIPYLSMSDAIRSLPADGLLIDSHFARPYTSGGYKGDTIYVDEPGWNTDDAMVLIEKYRTNNGHVYITGHALSEPYGLFSGPYLHPLSLSYRKKGVLYKLQNKWNLSLHTSLNKGLNLAIYEITNRDEGVKKIENLSQNERRIDYFDPVRVFVWAVRSGLNL